MMDLHDRVMGEAIRKVEDKKEAARKKSFSSIQRTNPTIAAMEIMTRKENAQNAMEERMMGLMQAKQQGKQQQPRQLSQGPQQGKAKANTSVTASSMSLRPISSPVASQNNAKVLVQPSNSKQSPAPSAKVQSSPQPARRPVVPEPSPVRKAIANSPVRPSQEQLRAQRMKEEAWPKRSPKGPFLSPT